MLAYGTITYQYLLTLINVTLIIYLLIMLFLSYVICTPPVNMNGENMCGNCCKKY